MEMPTNKQGRARLAVYRPSVSLEIVVLRPVASVLSIVRLGSFLPVSISDR